MACCGGEEDRRPAKPKPRVVPTSGDTKSKLYNTENVLLKIILLGDSSVGKTSIMRKFTVNKFDSNYKATIGADFLARELTVGKKQVTLQLWDTAGQERYESLGCAFYRGADACVLVFDVTNEQSFKRVNFWREKFMANSRLKTRGVEGEEVPISFMLLGNKADDVTHRVVPEHVAQDWADANSIPYIETSAKEGSNVEKAFQIIAEHTVKDINI